MDTIHCAGEVMKLHSCLLQLTQQPAPDMIKCQPPHSQALMFPLPIPPIPPRPCICISSLLPAAPCIADEELQAHLIEGVDPH